MEIYKTVANCAANDDLKEEWQGYLEETKTHHALLLKVFDQLGLNPKVQTPRA